MKFIYRDKMKKIREKVFKYRSYTPIPFLLVMFIFQQASLLSLFVGFGILLLGELFRFWGVAYAGSETRRTGEVGATYLVISGAFGYLRNPLYLGNILIYLGVGVMSLALFPYLQIGAFLFFYIQYRIIIAEEEEFLQNQYGRDYEEYKKNVPRFLPKIVPYKNGEIKQPPLNIKAGLRSELRTFQAIGFVTVTLIILYVLDRF